MKRSRELGTTIWFQLQIFDFQHLFHRQVSFSFFRQLGEFIFFKRIIG